MRISRRYLWMYALIDEKERLLPARFSCDQRRTVLVSW